MMFRIATKLWRRTSLVSHSPAAVRSFSVKPNEEFKPNPVALQMIDYAFSVYRSQKSDESHGQGLLVLEQCEANQPDDNSKGLVLLAMSTLLYERGKFVEAIEKLNSIKDLSVSSTALKGKSGGNSICVKVAASEAQAGLYLELGEDDTSSVIADVCLNYLDAVKLECLYDIGVLDARGRALKGLIELVRGDTALSGTYFEGLQDIVGTGNDALSYAEFLHAMRDFSAAKQLYQKVIQGVPENKDFSEPNSFAAGNMTSKNVLLAATCGLGQLEAHMGNFTDAEEMLTNALTRTEEHYGSHHPKVGVILTCIALMFRHKATMEHSSSLMVQEGLYRRAIELLKAPTLEEVADAKMCRKDIIALARGGYAETLCVQQNRKAAGEQMKTWAEAAWGNRRLSLAEALDISSEPSSKVPIIDARISRAL